MTRTSARPLALAIGQTPPPITGYSLITARMIAVLAETADIETINISPGNRQGFNKHIHKGGQVLRACWRIAIQRNTASLAYLGCEGDWGLIYTFGLALTARLFGYSILLHHHSFSYIDRRSTIMRVILMVGGEGISHIFLCTTMRQRFQARYQPVQRSRIISNAAFVEHPEHPLEDQVHLRPLRIGLLSNLTKEKGLHTFLDLVRNLKNSGFEVQGVLAGPIALEDDKRLVAAAETELAGALAYVGPIYGEAKERFYSDIDIFVFPTHYANEAQPTVLFEALAFGNWVVAYDRGCIGNQIGTHGLAVATTADFNDAATAFIKSHLLERPSVIERQKIASELLMNKEAALRSARSILAEENSALPRR